MPLLTLNRAGELPRTIAGLRVVNNLRAIHHPNGRAAGTMIFAQMFSDDPVWALSADKSGVVILERAIAASPNAAAFKVIKINSGGDTIFNKSFRYAPNRIPQALIDTVVASAAQSLVQARISSTTAEARRAVRRSFFLPTYFPPVSTMLTDADGRIWLHQAPARAGGNRWLLLSPEGNLIGDVEFPRAHRVIEAFGPGVWTTHTDELDVPLITRFRMIPR